MRGPWGSRSSNRIQMLRFGIVFQFVSFRFRRYRFVLWKRFSQKTPGKVIGLEYDPNRNAFLAKIETKNQSHYILATQGLKLGQIIESCPEAPLISGNALPLLGIPVGSEIHNI